MHHNDRVRVHYGPVGSGRSVIKGASARQEFAYKHGIQAFDREFDQVGWHSSALLLYDYLNSIAVRSTHFVLPTLLRFIPASTLPCGYEMTVGVASTLHDSGAPEIWLEGPLW